MTADVSSLVRVISDSNNEKSSVVITRDFLGGSLGNNNQELDLDMEVPPGWEKRLDLKSGRVYLQRCNSSNAPLQLPPHHKQQDGNNFMQSPKKSLLNLFESNSLELKLSSQLSTFSSSCSYQSVCTLDKVKSALERAEKDVNKKRTLLWKSSSSSLLYSSPSSSTRETQEDDEENNEKTLSSSTTTTCPRCLLYVLVSNSNPKCPGCDAVVPLSSVKKPRVDLNLSSM